VITETELRTSLRRQGFDSLSEVKAAILETSGTLTVERQDTTADEKYQQDLINRLTHIERALDQITQRWSFKNIVGYDNSWTSIKIKVKVYF
jgi:uncharacterized membrane protein YcaP (DUF421 family)